MLPSSRARSSDRVRRVQPIRRRRATPKVPGGRESHCQALEFQLKVSSSERLTVQFLNTGSAQTKVQKIIEMKQTPKGQTAKLL